MERRKIQLVAGKTYTVSLPKQWVVHRNLTKHREVIVRESSDGSLIVSPSLSITNGEKKRFVIDVHDYGAQVAQALFFAYYQGYDEICAKSSKGISREDRHTVKAAVSYMSGAEVVQETQDMILIKVFIDITKVEFSQLLYRIILITKNSIDCLSEQSSLHEIVENEEEIDRLYHLCAKMISISVSDVNIMSTSGIGTSVQALSFFLLAKRLENIEDEISQIALHFIDTKKFHKINKGVTDFILASLGLIEKQILSSKHGLFTKSPRNEVENALLRARESHGPEISHHLVTIIRFLVNVEEELVNISMHLRLTDS